MQGLYKNIEYYYGSYLSALPSQHVKRALSAEVMFGWGQVNAQCSAVT
jgi:hypothetical protein